MNYLQDSEDLTSILNKMISQSEEINLTHLVRPNRREGMIFFIQHFVFKTFSSTMAYAWRNVRFAIHAT